MSATLLQWVGECFHRTGRLKEMHCLGAVAGSTASPNGVGSCGGVVGVIRALGVLVSEGRVQGAPRGYKEGPHCAAPLQTVPNDHACEKDNYLCDRYLVLIREITDRISIGSYLCVEVLLCSDCPCGHAKATCKDPVFPVSSMSIASWQHSSEMLLEYWCINVVPSKGQEMMNSHGLYQAVRSRLHFSQVAAWWSRSKGANPSFVATRIVPHTEDNLRKFREPPIEHTFPLAGSSDGNSIKVTVWALPRMEEVPVLTCPMHPAMEKDEEGAARALTPTKNISVPTVTQNPETLVLPALVDDRLQTPCNEPGKHHCRCEEEDGCPPSPSIRPNNERKRRRSLPCGPADSDSCFAYHSIPLPSVQERAISERNARQANCLAFPNSSHSSDHSKYSGCPNYRGANAATDQGQTGRSDENAFVDCSNSDAGGFERCFAIMLNIDKHEGNIEKRYKPTIENSDSDRGKSFARHGEKSPKFGKKVAKSSSSKSIESSETTVPLSLSLHGNWIDSSEDHLYLVIPENEVETFQRPKERYNGVVSRSTVPPVPKQTNLVVNPFRERSPFHESNPGPSTYSVALEPKPYPTVPACAVHQSRSRTSSTIKSDVTDRLASLKNTALSSEQMTRRTSTKKCSTPEKNLSQLMSQLSFSEEKDSSKEEGGILEWISKVPGRVLGVATNSAFADEKSRTRSAKICDVHGNEAKTKNCNLELSQREFDEVLAVLRARTPSGRRRTPLRSTKRRDRLCGETISNKTLKSPSPNLEACQYPSNCETNYSTISCDGHDGSPCKKVGEIPAKPVWINGKNRNGTDQHGAEFQEKLTSPNTTREINKMEKQANKSTDCFYNVSNKADLLLGAILRSSKERKGFSDFSNGTGPRFSLSPSKSENESALQKDTTAKNINQGLKIVPLVEDEKSLPSTFNKRFHLFRQLFIKEQERKEILTSEIHSKDSLQNSQQRPYTSKLNNSCGTQVQSRQKAKESRVKRRIDFANFSEEAEKIEEHCEPSVVSDAKGERRNSTFCSTKYGEQGNSNAQREIFLGESTSRNHQELQNRQQSTKVGDKGNGEKTHRDWSIHENNYDGQNGFTPKFLQNNSSPASPQINGYPSSKMQNNNNYNDRVYSPNCGGSGSVDIEDNESFERGVPSAIEQERFRRSLENAASMVFHSRTGLPLTSSPAPLRRGSCCFDYDSSLNSVSSKRSALFELNTPPSPGAVSLEETDREVENTGECEYTRKRRSTSRSRPYSHALLGSFEESALNGRLEPVSTVHGFTAELGASGSFCPKHRKLPVTVFFYTLGDNDKVSTPYLAHINLGKKGYQVPRSGTIQVTLLNPLGTVVKMFVVLYDLSDMPPRSHTFLRQRTLRDKTLRYLVHLRFMSGKSGRIYLHTDIRMIICRKSDVDTASDFGSEPPKELRSYTHGPTNPKFSPRC